MSALVAWDATEQLAFLVPFARDNGVSEEELVETITHPAFYVGWPRAMAAIAAPRSTLVSQDGDGTNG